MTTAESPKIDQLLEALLDGNSQRSQAAFDALVSDPLQGPLPTDVVEKVTNTAALLTTIGQSEQSCVILDALLHRCEATPSLLNNLAFAHLLGGRTRRAVQLWEQAVKLDPDDELIASNLRHARSKLT